MEASVGRIQVGEIHQGQVVTVALVTMDPFIVVQKITAAIENEALFVDFDCFDMVRRMAVYDIDSGFVNEAVSKPLLGVRNFIAPIPSPMYRDDDNIAFFFYLSDFPCY